MSIAAEHFAAVVTGPEDAAGLDAACLLIAAAARGDADPDRVVSAGVAELDRMADRCGTTDLDGLRSFLFGAEAFTGNRRSYDDPQNSFLDDVLLRRMGIPITLSVVVMEVGRRVGVPLVGVGIPGHFLVGAGGERYVDAFNGGRTLDPAGCRRRFAEVAGPGAAWSPSYLAPVGARALLARVLANLRSVFAAAEDLPALARVLELRTAIPGVNPAERAERSAVLAALGQYGEAAAELDLMAALGGEDTEALRSGAAALRARLN
jgi:regulator of sirC expression with transglutaminase-like and TPR domain